jgi:threonine/homoserine/homoserine lactone efflux protein
MPPEKLWLFVMASLGLIVIPGPNVVYLVTRSLSQGRAAGFVSMLGINAGALTHALAAALGLSALLLTSALAFNAVKWVGALYLVYLGVRHMLRPAREGGLRLVPDRWPRLFGQGYLVSVFNPKVAIFMFAFLPQFVDPSSGAAAQILALGCLFVGLAMLSDGMYVLLASRVGRFFGRRPLAARRGKYVTGGVYIGLGLSSALMGTRQG